MIYRFGVFEVDAGQFQLRAAGKPVRIEGKALQVLIHLVEHQNSLVRKQELLSEVWKDSFVSESTLSRIIYLLRRTFAEFDGDPECIETVPKLGFRFMAPVDQAAPAASATPVKPELDTPPTIDSIAVVPFTTYASPEHHHLGDSLAEEVATALGEYSLVRIVSPVSTRRFAGGNATLEEMASALQVEAVCEGSVMRTDAHLRMSVRLMHGKTGRVLWSRQFESEWSAMHRLRTQISREIIFALGLPSQEGSEQRMQAGMALNAESYQLYLHAAYLYQHRIFNGDETAQELADAIDRLERAIAIDPGFATAHVMLAMIYARQIWYGRGDVRRSHAAASVLVQQALQLDRYCADAFFVRGALHLDPIAGFHWEVAARDYQAAIALKPHSLDANGRLGTLYMRAGLLDRAEEQTRLTLRLDPSYIIPLRSLGRILSMKQEFAAALEVYERVGWSVLPETALTLWRLGRRDEAGQKLNAAFAKEPELLRSYDAPSVQAIFHAESGEHEKARAAIRQTLENRRGETDVYFTFAMFRLAVAYAQMGDTAASLAMVEEAAANGLPCYPLYAGDPGLAPLRADEASAPVLARLRRQWEQLSATL